MAPTSATTTWRASRPRCARSWPRTSRSSGRSTVSTRGWSSSPTSRTKSRSSTAVDADRGGRRRRSSAPTATTTHFVDLCRGPHVPRTGRLGHFTLHAGGRRLLAGRRAPPPAAADLRDRVGVEEGPADHLHRLEEAEKRDHRRLGAELDLFHFPPEIGGGLAVFHPKGGLVRKLMEDHARPSTNGPATSSSSPRTWPSRPCSRSRATSVGTPTACTRPWRWRARPTTPSP